MQSAGIVLLLVSGLAQAAHAKETPVDFCALLPAGDVARILGVKILDPLRTNPPEDTNDVARGGECVYGTQGSGRAKVTLVVFENISDAAAKRSFHRLNSSFGIAKTLNGVGEEAYVDKIHAVHARKGKIRWFVSIRPDGEPITTIDRLTQELAAVVASRL